MATKEFPSVRGHWAQSVLRRELALEIPAVAGRGRNFKGLPPSFVGSPVGTPGEIIALNPDQLPADTTQDEDIEIPTTGFRAPAASAPDLDPMRLCIVGAGVSGLYIAMILDSLGIPNLEYDILESSDRIGGRIFTHQFDSSTPHQYYDIGAMRFPRIPIMDR